MRVKDLIQKLQKYDENLQVIVKDEVEGNDYPLVSLSLGKTQVDACDPEAVSKVCLWLRG